MKGQAGHVGFSDDLPTNRALWESKEKVLLMIQSRRAAVLERVDILDGSVSYKCWESRRVRVKPVLDKSPLWQGQAAVRTKSTLNLLLTLLSITRANVRRENCGDCLGSRQGLGTREGKPNSGAAHPLPTGGQ